jgi:DNA polymerase III sliding clamp (beta) subunit (PCNA family)
VTFDTDELASALKAVDAVRSNGTPVRLSLGDPCSLSLVEQDNATVSESLSAATFSPDGVGAIEVAFNPKFLADGIRFLGGDRIEMWLRDSLKPALLGSNECRYLLMPVRTS